MKNVLLLQEGGGHGEVLGGFLEPLCHIANDDVEVCIYVLSGDSYGIFSLYDQLGYEFIAFDRTDSDHLFKIYQLVRDDYYDLIIFNSAPDWENTLFKSDMLERLRAEIFVLHHSNIRHELRHPFIKLGTSSLLSKVVDSVFTPYYDATTLVSNFKENCTDERRRVFGLLGGHYPAALCMRDESKVLSLISDIMESPKSRELLLTVNWYVAHYSQALKEKFGKYSSIFKEGYSHLDIYQNVACDMVFWATYFKDNTRYERDGMTGTLPFALNGGMPVLGTSNFLEIYGFTEKYINACVAINDNPRSISDLTNHDYSLIRGMALDTRNNQINRNRSLLKRHIV